jgi:hypothetical protein
MRVTTSRQAVASTRRAAAIRQHQHAPLEPAHQQQQRQALRGGVQLAFEKQRLPVLAHFGFGPPAVQPQPRVARHEQREYGAEQTGTQRDGRRAQHRPACRPGRLRDIQQRHDGHDRRRHERERLPRNLGIAVGARGQHRDHLDAGARLDGGSAFADRLLVGFGQAHGCIHTAHLGPNDQCRSCSGLYKRGPHNMHKRQR